MINYIFISHKLILLNILFHLLNIEKDAPRISFIFIASFKTTSCFSTSAVTTRQPHKHLFPPLPLLSVFRILSPLPLRDKFCSFIPSPFQSTSPFGSIHLHPAYYCVKYSFINLLHTSKSLQKDVVQLLQQITPLQDNVLPYKASENNNETGRKCAPNWDEKLPPTRTEKYLQL